MRFIFALPLLIGFVCPLQSATTNALSQWNISFQFSNDCVYGTFVNGDYWVVAPVVITNMTPGWDGNYNGWEINPLVQFRQGFSSNSRTGSTYSNILRPDMPFTLTTNCSLVKTVGNTNLAGVTSVATAAVLTVLTAIPPNNGLDVFRPPYVGTNKPLYRVSDLQSNLLPAYAVVSNAPTLDSISNTFSKCLRMDHHSVVARWFRPSSSMDDYQPENTIVLNEAMLRLMLDDTYSNKLPALIQFTQHTIDHAYAIMGGYRRIDDGHNPDHRVLGAWAGVMLNDTNILTYMATATGFHEDYYLFNGINGPLWGSQSTELAYWRFIMGLTSTKDDADPYDYIDGGALSSVGSAYQNITSQPFKGQALIFKLFPSMQSCIPSSNYNTLAGYSQRWVNHGVLGAPDPVAPYDGNTNNYGVTFGPDGFGSFIPGPGRFIIYDGASRDGGQYKSLFVSNMWYSYWTAPEMTIKGKAKFLGKATIR